MSDDEMTTAQTVGLIGFLLVLVGGAMLVVASIGAVVGSAAGWDGWFRTVDIAVGVASIPVVGVGLFCLGHPPGEGPMFLRKER